MPGTDPTTPHPTETGVPGAQEPATVPPARRPSPAVHVGGPGQASPDDAPTGLMPSLGAPDPEGAAHDLADATRVAAPLPRTAPSDGDSTRRLTATPPAPTRTPSYSARRAPAAPPAGPHGGLYADPLAGAPRQQPGPAPLPGPVPLPDSAAPSRPSTTGHAQAAPAAAPSPVRRGGATSFGRVEPRVAVLGGVVGVLVVVAVVLGFTMFGGSGSPVATPSAGASVSADAGAKPVVSEHFASPSRNISCTVTTAEATCRIAALAKKPTPVDGCDGTVGYVAKVEADGTVTTPCVPRRDQPKVAAKSVHVLGYGESVTLGKLACTSSESGVRCLEKDTGKGFTIARAGIGGV